MQCVLNFSDSDRKAILLFLEKFPEKKTKTGFEEFRCAIGKSTATLYKSGKLLLQGEDCKQAKERVLKALEVEDKPVLGIDETGRGESFGSFTIAAVLARPSKMRELRDSKKVKDLAAKKRVVEENALATGIFSISSKELGELHKAGISLNKLEAAAINFWHDFFAGLEKVPILVDGNPLKGCRKGVSFIVKGDDLNPVIGAASVIAKSARESSGDKGKRLGWGSWQKGKAKQGKMA